MEYSPPPLFKQGASARAKLAIFALIAIALLLVDARLKSLGQIRQVVSTILYPLQVVALMPRDAAYMVDDYFSTVAALQSENGKLKRERLANAQALQQMQQLSAENAQLRKLLGATERLPVKSMMGEILYDARDAFTRKIVMDRGAKHGAAPGQPVIDDAGVVGQVTRVFAFTSEVTLLTDKDQAIPVQVLRTGLRSIAYGQGHSGLLDLRFMPVNADIRNGDILVTSGIDGIYPAGLAVAKVIQVESKSSDAFARIVCQPLAGIDRNRQLLILLNEAKLPPRPEPADPKKDWQTRKEAAKAAQKEQPVKDPAQDAQKEPAQKAPAKEPQKVAPKESVKQAPQKEPVKQAPPKAPAPENAPAAEQKRPTP